MSAERQSSRELPLSLDKVLREKLADPEFRQAYERLGPGYQVACLRKMRRLTQSQLAKLVGTKQPSIARLESGTALPKLGFLQRVVDVLGGTLIIRIEAPDLDNPTSDAHLEQRTDGI